MLVAGLAKSPETAQAKNKKQRRANFILAGNKQIRIIINNKLGRGI